jgi:hypothetical protein
MRWLCVLGVMLWLAAAAAPARADEQTASGGPVTATFSFSSAREFAGADAMQLTITRNGQQLYAGHPQVGDCDHFHACGPGAGPDRNSVSVRDLDGDGEPEVLLDLYWGGAHCCFFANVYSFDGTGYRAVSHDFADAGYRLADLDHDGRPEFVSADARFAYQFAAFAFSLFPVQIWSFRHGAFADATSRFPGRIRSDEHRAWNAYRAQLRHRGDEPRGAIAAWAADRYRLGRRAATLRTLRRLAREGRLPGTLPTSQRRFVSELDRFLRRHGY